MARKTTAPPATGKAPPRQPTPRAIPRATTAASSGNDSNRLLREAAWSRMFGRTESKNPFTR